MQARGVDPMRKSLFVACLATWGVVSHAGPVQWSGNGHWYERVDQGGITWDEAQSAAASRGGSLVTITSVEESVFLTETEGIGWEMDTFGTRFDDLLHYHWLGGYQDPPDEPDPGANWRWVTGETFGFDNWAAPGEPNDTPAPEFTIVFDHGITAQGKQWNDLNGAWGVDGYVIEWNQVQGVPDNGAFLSLITGLGTLWVATRRRS